ncbi:MAG: radical SAM protein, partial [Candidatus Lindowbacteria bacterium]|nr:radical SAM protein [Candidatus Lindowbacteria bacterium]
YSRGERSTSIISSRGCQYLCNFCTPFKVFTRTPRLRSADNVLAEMRHLKEEYGVDEIFFEDDQLLAKRDRAIELFDAMASELKILFDTPNGISQWLLTEDIIRRMKAAGCYRINLALESGNQWVLDNIIIKPVKIDMVPETVRLIRKYDMDVGMFIVAGNIAWDTVETFEQLADSFKLARKINIRPHVSYLTGYPGSQVLEIAQKKGWLVDNFTWEDLCIHRQQIRSDEWTCEELSEFVERQQTLCFLNYVLKNPLKTAVNISTSLKHNGPTYIASRFKDWGFRIFADVLKDENGRQRFVPKFLMNDANVRTG